MPQTAGRFPAHAVAEIEEAKGKRRKELERFWESWALVGDRKADHARRLADLDDLVAPLAGKRLTKDDVARIRAAEAAAADALAAVDAAVEQFKAGG